MNTNNFQRKLDEIAGRKLRLGKISFDDVVEILEDEIDNLNISTLAEILRDDTTSTTESSYNYTEITDEYKNDIKNVIYEMIEDNDEVLMELLKDVVTNILKNDSYNSDITDDKQITKNNKQIVLDKEEPIDFTEENMELLNNFFGFSDDTKETEFEQTVSEKDTNNLEKYTHNKNDIESIDFSDVLELLENELEDEEITNKSKEDKGVNLFNTIIKDEEKLRKLVNSICGNKKSDDNEVNSLVELIKDEKLREQLLDSLSQSINEESEDTDIKGYIEHKIINIDEDNGLRFMLACNMHDIMELKHIERSKDNDLTISIIASETEDIKDSVPLFFTSAELCLDTIIKSGQLSDILSDAYSKIDKANEAIKIINELKYDNKIGLMEAVIENHITKMPLNVTDIEMVKQINQVYKYLTGKYPSYCKSNYLGEILVDGLRAYLMLTLLKSTSKVERLFYFMDYMVVRKDEKWLDETILDLSGSADESFIYTGLKNVLNNEHEIKLFDCLRILEYLNDVESLENIDKNNCLYSKIVLVLLSAYEQISEFI